MFKRVFSNNGNISLNDFKHPLIRDKIYRNMNFSCEAPASIIEAKTSFLCYDKTLSNLTDCDICCECKHISKYCQCKEANNFLYPYGQYDDIYHYNNVINKCDPCKKIIYPSQTQFRSCSYNQLDNCDIRARTAAYAIYPQMNNCQPPIPHDYTPPLQNQVCCNPLDTNICYSRKNIGCMPDTNIYGYPQTSIQNSPSSICCQRPRVYNRCYPQVNIYCAEPKCCPEKPRCCPEKPRCCPEKPRCCPEKPRCLLERRIFHTRR